MTRTSSAYRFAPRTAFRMGGASFLAQMMTAMPAMAYREGSIGGGLRVRGGRRGRRHPRRT
jgi:hypothetical protein